MCLQLNVTSCTSDGKAMVVLTVSGKYWYFSDNPVSQQLFTHSRLLTCFQVGPPGAPKDKLHYKSKLSPLVVALIDMPL